MLLHMPWVILANAIVLVPLPNADRRVPLHYEHSVVSGEVLEQLVRSANRSRRFGRTRQFFDSGPVVRHFRLAAGSGEGQ